MTDTEPTDNAEHKSLLAKRFRGFLPVVIDVETGGFNSATDAILQIGACIIDVDQDGNLHRNDTLFYHVTPFDGANLEPAALQFTGIDPDDPAREAVDEGEALLDLFQHIRRAVKAHGCTRAVLVGHNAFFDHGFIMAAAERLDIKRNPLHPFSVFDTVSFAALAYGQTVLAKSCAAADIPFDNKQAHAADYDTEKTADLFCKIINRWQELGEWPLAAPTGDDKIET
ncbi:MAG: ribonuclease T [Pseudomonadales bacterium]